jgi:hypothetical protein
MLLTLRSASSRHSFANSSPTGSPTRSGGDASSTKTSPEHHAPGSLPLFSICGCPLSHSNGRVRLNPPAVVVTRVEVLQSVRNRCERELLTRQPALDCDGGCKLNAIGISQSLEIRHTHARKFGSNEGDGGHHSFKRVKGIILSRLHCLLQ